MWVQVDSTDADKIMAHELQKVPDHEDNVSMKRPLKSLSYRGRQLIEHPTFIVSHIFLK